MASIEEIKSREQVLVEKEKQLYARLTETRNRATTRFPLLFALLATFGLVATYYGFEHIIDSIDFLSQNPILLLGFGVALLLATGSLYRKLQ